MAADVELLTFFIAAFISLLTIVNPFSTTSIYMTITKGDSVKKKRQMAMRASYVGAVTLIVFALLGSYILSFFSITLDAFRIAGGILIAGVGYRMVRATREHVKTDEEKKELAKRDDVSIIPLAIPMTAGPGSMTTAIVLMGEAQGFMQASSLLIAIILVCVVSYFVLSRAHLIYRVLGHAGAKITDRVMGLIVLVVGVQFIINGVTGVVIGWGLSPPTW